MPKPKRVQSAARRRTPKRRVASKKKAVVPRRARAATASSDNGRSAVAAVKPHAWMAYETMIQKMEAMYAPLSEIHRRLDAEGMRGKRFSEILQRIVELYDAQEFYAGVIARTYPGYDSAEPGVADLRAFLRERRRA